MSACGIRYVVRNAPVLTWFEQRCMKRRYSTSVGMMHWLVVRKWTSWFEAVLFSFEFMSVTTELSYRRFFSSEKALLTSKRSSFMLFIESYLLVWPSYGGIKYFTRRIRIRIGRIKIIRDFGTHRFRTLPASLTLIKDSVSFAIVRRAQVSSFEGWRPRIGGDISVRSVIYPTGRPFCFGGNPNNNVLPTLLIIEKKATEYFIFSFFKSERQCSLGGGDHFSLHAAVDHMCSTSWMKWCLWCSG